MGSWTRPSRWPNRLSTKIDEAQQQFNESAAAAHGPPARARLSNTTSTGDRSSQVAPPAAGRTPAVGRSRSPRAPPASRRRRPSPPPPARSAAQPPASEGLARPRPAPAADARRSRPPRPKPAPGPRRRAPPSACEGHRARSDAERPADDDERRSPRRAESTLRESPAMPELGPSSRPWSRRSTQQRRVNEEAFVAPAAPPARPRLGRPRGLPAPPARRPRSPTRSSCA